MTQESAPKLSAEDASLLFGDQDTTEQIGDWKFVSIEEGDDRRWSRTNQMILENQIDNNYYALEYEQGLTEGQDNEYPWRPDYVPAPEYVQVYRVYPKTKIITEYWRALD